MSRSSQLFARVVLGSCLSVLPMGFAWSADRPAAAVSGNEVLKYTTPAGESFVAIEHSRTFMPATAIARPVPAAGW